MNFDEFWNAVKDFKHDLLLKTLDRELEFEVSQRSKRPIIPKNNPAPRAKRIPNICIIY